MATPLDKSKIDALKAVKNSSLLIRLIQEQVKSSPETAVDLLNELGDNLESLGGIDLSALESLQGADGKTPEFGVDYMTEEEIDGLEQFITDNLDTLGDKLGERLTQSIQSAQAQLNNAVAQIKNGQDGKNGMDGKDVTQKDIKAVFDEFKNELKDNPLEIVEKIKNVRGSKRLGFKNVRGLPELEKKVIDNEDDIEKMRGEMLTEINIASTAGGGGDSSTFQELTDTPSSYVGQSGLYAKVNATEDGLEFDTATGGGETNTGLNIGLGEGKVFKQKAGVNLEMRTLKAGTNITLTEGVEEILIDATGGGAGEVNTASNVGTGAGEVFKQKTGDDLELKTIKAGANITVTNNGDDIEIAATGGASGESNTASNVGAGSGVFKQKTGVDLEMKTLIGGTNVTLTEGTDAITIDAVGGSGSTDLSITNKTSTTLDVASSSGTDATVPEATITEAGLLAATDKTKLLGIETGAEVNNISDLNANALVDTTENALHYHDTDRARANHTGTQTASTISDFDTEVANNADVTANTAKISYTDAAAVALNTAKETNVDTNLSEGTVTNTTVDVNSSDGTNATIAAASTSRAGVMSKATFDAVTANTAKTGVTDQISNVVEDTTPQLGGELDAQANSIGFTLQTATGDGTTTIDWTNGNKFNFTFGAQNETFTFTAPSKPGNFLLLLKQDATGGRTATFPTILWAGGTTPTLTASGSGIDIIAIYYDGTNYYGNASLNFS